MKKIALSIPVLLLTSLVGCKGNEIDFTGEYKFSNQLVYSGYKKISTSSWIYENELHICDLSINEADKKISFAFVDNKTEVKDNFSFEYDKTKVIENSIKIYSIKDEKNTSGTFTMSKYGEAYKFRIGSNDIVFKNFPKYKDITNLSFYVLKSDAKIIQINDIYGDWKATTVSEHSPAFKVNSSYHFDPCGEDRVQITEDGLAKDYKIWSYMGTNIEPQFGIGIDLNVKDHYYSNMENDFVIITANEKEMFGYFLTNSKQYKYDRYQVACPEHVIFTK